jgi:hypothetical protein
MSSNLPNTHISETCAEKANDSSISIKESEEEEIMAAMPRTFKIFRELLQKAEERRSKRASGL